MGARKTYAKEALSTDTAFLLLTNITHTAKYTDAAAVIVQEAVDVIRKHIANIEKRHHFPLMGKAS